MTTAAACDVSVIVFPELSLTGYEPDLAAALAFTSGDGRLAPLRRLVTQHPIALVVGAPVRNGAGNPAIGAFVFTPDGDVRTYLKMHLGASERAHFSQGDRPLAVDVGGQKLGIAICADSSRASHPATYAELGATIYAAGVFLTEEWYVTDVPRLQSYAAAYGMLTLMANHGSSTGTHESVGRSAAWAPGGELLVQAGGVERVLVTATLEETGWRGEVVRIPG